MNELANYEQIFQENADKGGGALYPAYLKMRDEVDVSSSVELCLLAHKFLFYSGQSEAAGRVVIEGLKRHPGSLTLSITGCQRFIDGGNVGLALELSRSLTQFDLSKMDEWELRNTCRCFSATGLHDEAYVAYRELQGRGSNYGSAGLESRLHCAIENSKAAEGVLMISIGSDCKPWLVLNRWGLRPDLSVEGHQSEFMLCQASTEGVKAAIENPDLLMSGLRIIDEASGKPCPANVLRYAFNHNVGPLWINDDFRELRNVYSHRQKLLENSYSAGPRVYVHFTPDPGQFIQPMIDAVTAKNKNNDYQIVIVHQTDEPINLDADDHITYRTTKYPSNDHVWFHPDHFESDEGLAYERSITEAALAGLEELRMRLS